MKTIADYFERAQHFERMASNEENPALKADLARQALAYRKLAAERAQHLGVSPPADTT